MLMLLYGAFVLKKDKITHDTDYDILLFSGGYVNRFKSIVHPRSKNITKILLP